MSHPSIHQLSAATEVSDSGYLARCLGGGILSSIPVSSGFFVGSSLYEDMKTSGIIELTPPMMESILTGVSIIEKDLGSSVQFGNTKRPLLMDLRGDMGSFSWCPLPTVEYVGMNDAVAFILEKQTGSRSLAYNAYRRLISTYSYCVLGIPTSVFDRCLVDYCKSHAIASVSDFSGSDWVEITKLYKSIVMKRSGVPFPQDPTIQLKRSIEGIYHTYSAICAKSANCSSCAKSSCDCNFSIVFIQSRYGFTGPKSFSCSMSSRNNEDGSPLPSGVVGVNSSLEDVKRGLCKTHSLKWNKDSHSVSCPNVSDSILSNVVNVCRECERSFGSPCVVDFIIDDERISVVSISRASLKGGSIFRAVHDMVNSGVIDRNGALKSVCYEDVVELSCLRADPGEQPPLGHGTGSGLGSVVGRACFSRESIEKCTKEGDSAIYFCRRLYMEDMAFLSKVSGVVSIDGNSFSTESVYCRTNRKPSSIGFRHISKDIERVCVSDVKEFPFAEGDTVTISGEGSVYPGAIPMAAALAVTDKSASAILSWSDEIRHGKFNIYVDVPDIDNLKSNVGIGEDGIGCIRFESLLRGRRGEVMLAYLKSGNEKYATALESQLVKDLTNLMVSRRGTTVCIRLLEDISQLQSTEQSTQEAGLSNDEFTGLLNRRVLQLQARSISNGAYSANVHVRVLVPSIIDRSEVQIVRSVFDECEGCRPLIGGELHSVRSCLVSDLILKDCDFVEIDVPRVLSSGCFENVNELIPLIESCCSSRNSKDVGVRGVSRGDDLESCVRSGLSYCVVGGRDVSAARICSARALV